MAQQPSVSFQIALTLLAALLLGGHASLVRDVWVGGRHVVEDGTHFRWSSAVEDYRKVASEIWD